MYQALFLPKTTPEAPPSQAVWTGFVPIPGQCTGFVTLSSHYCSVHLFMHSPGLFSGRPNGGNQPIASTLALWWLQKWADGRQRGQVSIRRGGGGGGGGLKGGRGGGGFGRTPPPPSVPLWSPPKGGRKFLKLKSSWPRRRRSKILAASFKHYKRRRQGGRGSKGREVGGVRGGTPPPPRVYGRSNTSLGGGGYNI